MPTQNNNKEVSKCCGAGRLTSQCMCGEHIPTESMCSKCGKPFEPTVPTTEEKCSGCGKCTDRATTSEECLKMGYCPCHYTPSNTEEWRSKIFNIIAKLDNGSHSSSQLQGIDEALTELFSQSESCIKAEMLRELWNLIPEAGDGTEKDHQTKIVEDVFERVAYKYKIIIEPSE